MSSVINWNNNTEFHSFLSYKIKGYCSKFSQSVMSELFYRASILKNTGERWIPIFPKHVSCVQAPQSRYETSVIQGVTGWRGNVRSICFCILGYKLIKITLSDKLNIFLYHFGWTHNYNT